MSLIIHSLSSTNPSEYVNSYDPEENAEGITSGQLKIALFRVTKGKDKAQVIALGSSVELLKVRDGELWRFSPKTGMVGPLTIPSRKSKERRSSRG